VQVSEVSGIPTGLAVPTFFNGTNVAWLDLASNPCNSCSTEIETDLGDAPDSTNHFQNTPMTAYVGVLASFPTVFDPLTGAPQGPIHLRATEDAWLGASVSDENEADLPPDQDMATNLTPPVDISNQDGFDDGAAGTVFLPQCQPANINYTITVAGPVRTRYTNLWIDFNRDGDWADSLTCLDGQGQALSVPEWAIQNQTSNLGPGQYNLVTPPFISYSPSPPISAWMRLSLTDAPNLGADGRGQSGGYEYGETEDFLMVPTATANEYVLQ